MSLIPSKNTIGVSVRHKKFIFGLWFEISVILPFFFFHNALMTSITIESDKKSDQAVTWQVGHGLWIHLSYSFSVLIPAFNKCQFLGQAIDSVMELELEKGFCEIVVCDDQSTDCTYSIVSEYRRRYASIVYMRNEERLGTFATRIRLVESARGEYLSFLDADDSFVKEGVIKALEVIKEQELELVEYRCRRTDGMNKDKFYPCWMPAKVGTVSAALYRRLIKLEKTNWMIHRKVFRAKMYKEGLKLVPDQMKRMKICMAEDMLHLVYATAFMTKRVHTVSVYGYEYHGGLCNNSVSGAYEGRNVIYPRARAITRLCHRLLQRRATVTPREMMDTTQGIQKVYARFYRDWPQETDKRNV